MTEWIVCPTCNLRHGRRPDGRCPRCRETVDRGASAAGHRPAEPAVRRSAAAADAPAPGTWRGSGRSGVARPALPDAAGSGTWIAGMVRTRAVRRLATCAAVVALTLLVGVANVRYLRNFAGGPYAMSAADLDAISNVATAPRYFARVTGSETLDTGVASYEVESESGREVRRTLKASYFALDTGGRLLIVKTAGAPTTTVEGGLVPIPPDLDQHLFGNPEMRAIRGRFYPYHMDTGSFRSDGYWGLGIGAVVLLITGFAAVRARAQLRDPAAHAAVARAASWGELGAMSAAVRGEFERPGRRSGPVFLTENYAVTSSFYRFDVVRLDDLLWAYKRVTKKSVNLIPVGKDFHAILACVGGTVEFKAKESEVDETLRWVASRVPWAVFGHSKEIEEMMKKDPAGFAAGVAERRRQHAVPAASA
jgi:uncharacterized protein DUF6709